MKALNRAIARTVSQIARHAGEGCHVPMIMALENHLDALLTMERKMLEGVQEVEGPVPSNSLFAPQDSEYWTPERIAVFNRWENVQPPKNSNDNAQPAPDVIDMEDPANWQVGDVVRCNETGNSHTVIAAHADLLTLSGIRIALFHELASNAFTWVRNTTKEAAK